MRSPGEGSSILGQTAKAFDELTLPSGAADPKLKVFNHRPLRQPGSRSAALKPL